MLHFVVYGYRPNVFRRPAIVVVIAGEGAPDPAANDENAIGTQLPVEGGEPEDSDADPEADVLAIFPEVSSGKKQGEEMESKGADRPWAKNVRQEKYSARPLSYASSMRG